MTFLVYTDLIEVGINDGRSLVEQYVVSDNRELEVLVALVADQTSDDPNYTNDWPGWDGETKSYYIADPDVLHDLARQCDVAVKIGEILEI